MLEETTVKLCLIVSNDIDYRTHACGIIENMGFLCTEIMDIGDVFVACRALMPDIIVINDADIPAHDSFAEKMAAMTIDTSPVIIFSDRRIETETSGLGCLAGADPLFMKFAQLGLIPDPIQAACL